MPTKIEPKSVDFEANLSAAQRMVRTYIITTHTASHAGQGCPALHVSLSNRIEATLYSFKNPDNNVHTAFSCSAVRFQRFFFLPRITYSVGSGINCLPQSFPNSLLWYVLFERVVVVSIVSEYRYHGRQRLGYVNHWHCRNHMQWFSLTMRWAVIWPLAIKKIFILYLAFLA